MTISPRIFLCHAHEDKGKVREIHRRLLAMGLTPWKDSEDLPPGAEWQRLIRKTLRKTDFVLVCCTRLSVRKQGYFQREIREALEFAKEKSPGHLYLIPARLEECEPHEYLYEKFNHFDLFDDDGYSRLAEGIGLEMMRRGCIVTTDESGRLIFEAAKSSEEPASDAKTKLLSPESTAGVREESPTKSLTTQPLVKPIKVRLQDVVKSLETLYGSPNLEEESPLHDLLEQIERFVAAVGLIEREPSEHTDFCIRCISELLKKTVNKHANELTKFITQDHCTLSFDFTVADFTNLLLSKHMKRLKKGGHYYVISDVASWRELQLLEFRKQTKQAVKDGAQIQRVFNLMLEPHLNPLKLRDKRRILEQHLEDSETWASADKGRYEVRVFDRFYLNRLAEKMPAGATRAEQEIEKAHFGIFSHETRVQTLVEYEVKAFDLSSIDLKRGSDEIQKHLRIFKVVWDEASPLTQEEINRIFKQKKSAKRPDEAH